MPQTNAVVERLNGDILAGTRTVLVRAGLPTCFWPWAGEHYCFMENTHYDYASESPWYRTHGDEFTGERLPFGCKVIIKPAETKNVDKSQMEEPTITGIFAGYEITPGYGWSGAY